MSEKLSFNEGSSEASKWDTLAEVSAKGEERPEPAFEGDPSQYSEEELMADPAKRYHVNPAEFPIFAEQYERFVYVERGEEKIGKQFYDINKTLGLHLAKTADVIATIAGEDKNGMIFQRGETTGVAYDHVVYLDKSARPVSWLVNTFWEDFSEKKRPPHSYLAIDRSDWFTEVGLKVSKDGRKEDLTKATFEDFKKAADKLPAETFAQVRALFIPEGIEDEDPEKIMATPTPLDGKQILVVDEVGRTGATQQIAKYLLERALQPVSEGAPRTVIETTTYWPSGTITVNGEQDMATSPVWYDRNSAYGRGIGDRDPVYFEKVFEEHPNPRTRARRFGAKLLGRPINLAEEPGRRSRELAEEIKRMHKEFLAGHIMFNTPFKYDQDKWMDYLEGQGVVFVAQESHARDPKPMPKNAFVKILENQNKLDKKIYSDN